MDLGISGRRAAVAAASGGLGLGAARALVADGVDVAICGRDPDRLAGAVAELEGLGSGSVHGLAGDVSTVEGAQAFVTDATEALGRGRHPRAERRRASRRRLSPTPTWPPTRPALELSLLSTVAMCQAAVPAMREQRWGRVVAITSVSVRQPIPGLILSNTARAGVTGFLKTLALEVAGDGVTVNSVQPGSHATDRLRSLHGGDLSSAARSVPTGELGRPEDFGAVVAFLCSDQARFITGAALPVDGGAYRALQ